MWGDQSVGLSFAMAHGPWPMAHGCQFCSAAAPLCPGLSAYLHLVLARASYHTGTTRSIGQLMKSIIILCLLLTFLTISCFTVEVIFLSFDDWDDRNLLLRKFFFRCDFKLSAKPQSAATFLGCPMGSNNRKIHRVLSTRPSDGDWQFSLTSGYVDLKRTCTTCGSLFIGHVFFDGLR